MDTSGTGNFTFGYFGSVSLALAPRASVDAANGLIYLGNPFPAEERLQGGQVGCITIPRPGAS